jgi:hypothetical protein
LVNRMGEAGRRREAWELFGDVRGESRYVRKGHADRELIPITNILRDS